MQDGPLYKDGGGKGLGHVRMVQLGEAKGRLAELTVLLLGVGEPFHQAVLVDEFDTAATLARVEERFVL